MYFFSWCSKLSTSRVSKKGLTTIPSSVRRNLGIEEGDILIWEVDKEGGIAVVKVVKNPLKNLKGKYSLDMLRYDVVEEEADKLIEGELGGGD